MTTDQLLDFRIDLLRRHLNQRYEELIQQAGGPGENDYATYARVRHMLGPDGFHDLLNEAQAAYLAAEIERRTCSQQNNAVAGSCD